jgi:hypothetical protein
MKENGSQRGRGRMITRVALGVTLAMLGSVAFLAVVALGGQEPADCPPNACEIPPTAWASLAPEKRAFLEQMRRAKEKALEQSRDATATPPAVHAVTPEAWPEGMFETRQNPLPKGFYLIENQWQSDSYGSHLQIYAGSLEANPDQGVVVLQDTPFDLTDAEAEEFLTPFEAGAVRIVAVNGQRLTLVSKAGNVFTFHVGTRALVEPEPLPVWPSGIFEFGAAPFPAGQPFPGNMLNVENVWQGTVDAQYVRVFAGSYLSASSQGVVVVQSVPSSLWPESPSGEGPEAIHLTPANAGTLRITAENEGRLALVSTSGAGFTFDLKSNALEASTQQASER